ncbi:hypothetical protein [Hyphococcus sp.]|uniref:hypothetical protein n=1 Tax=Hyphococcus sp. TaxID=2038636 RepID=UPI00207DC2C4|nr:MAG: hypothetical protein DHS20C04_00930 [Marinicaulis sp.]
MKKKIQQSNDLADEFLRKAFDAEEDGQLEEAICLLKKAARLGSNAARSKLGTTYDDVVTPSQPDRAVYWYKQGVKNGYSDCAWNLAMHYAGLGRRRGYLYWLRIANEMGDEDAPEELRTGEWWSKRTKDIARK